MAEFLNIDLSGKTKWKFIFKHFCFSSVWIFGILILFFRLDLIILNYLGVDLPWLEGTIPLILFVFAALIILTQKWYYTLAFIFYPVLSIGWFIPKVVLKKGKIYLLGNYLNSVFGFFKNFKLSIIKILAVCSALILLFVVNQNWSRWFALMIFSIVYFSYVYNFIKSSFQPAKLFGTSVEDAIKKIISNDNIKQSLLIKSYVLQTTDDKLKQQQKKQKQIFRLITLNYIIEYTSEQLNGFKGKRAFVISLIFSLIVFIIYSVIFFWFTNYQLYTIDSSNFIVTSNPSVFEFLYYSFKSVFTFGTTDLLVPASMIAKSIHIISFLILGLFVIVIAISLLFSLRNDKIKENIKLTTELCENQKIVVSKFMENEYKTTIQKSMSEITNISQSMQKLKATLEKVF